MDSYFKAAVCDLDKLLDEFEQNTDECECFRTPQNPYDSKLPSALDCLEHAHPTPGLPEDPAGCPAPEESSLRAPAGTGDVLSFSPPKEKGVAGPDLLSTVDSGSLNEVQALSLGRCGVPVCDLISDTANLISSVAAAEGAPDELRGSQGSAGCGMSCVPVPVGVASPGCSGAASTQLRDGDSVFEDSGHLTTGQINNLALKPESYAAGAVLGLCGDQHRREPVMCNEVLDHPGQTAALDAECVAVASQSWNARGPKDEEACGKLPLETRGDSVCSAASKEVYGGDAVGKVEPNDGSHAGSMPSDLPKRHPLHSSNAAIPGNCVLPGSSCQGGAEVELEKKGPEENVGSEELSSSETPSRVSSSCMSAEDVQTSVSCLSLPVSVCGSLAVTEEKVNPLPQNAVAEAIGDTVTVHAGESKTHLPGRESCESTSWHEREDVAEISESIAEESRGGEKYTAENVIDDSDSQQVKAFASAFLDLGAEPYAVGVDTFYDESMSSVMSDFTVEESAVKSDILISDAELDDFLYGQSLQSSELKSSDNDGNLVEADADRGSLTDLNNLDFTEVKEELMQTKLEEITSINSNLQASIPDSEVEAAAEVSMSQSQGMTESGGGALASDVCIKGARPKQLLDLSQGAAGQKQLNRTNELERGNQESSSVSPEAPLSTASVDVGKPDPEEGSSEAGASQTSESAEPRKAPAALSWKQPLWVPDSEAPNCMNCQAKFTFTKRRHHCRACGKVFCGSCCKRKCKLQYMEKEARVCTGCYDDINKAQAFERMMSPTGPVPNSSVSSERSSAVPPVEEAQVAGGASSPSPSALPPVSALKQPGPEGLCPREQKRVWFADGILPNGEVADTAKLSSGAKRSQDSSPENADLPETPAAANPEEDDLVAGVNQKLKEEIDKMTRTEELHPSVPSDGAQQATPGQSEVTPSNRCVSLGPEESCPAAAEESSPSSVGQSTRAVPVAASSYRALCGVENWVRRDISLLPDGDQLPPLLLALGETGKDLLVEEHPFHQKVTSLLGEGGPNPLTFILNANLLVNVKLITYSSEKCWCFSTNGLHGLGQAEIVILLQRLPEEDVFPSEIFKLFLDIYKDAVKGKFIKNMENITFTENFLGNKEHGGFLFVAPTFQKLDDQVLPDNPFLCGILIHKLEIPWAKVFPIRLMLRLGAEYGAYPTPLVSVRHRKPLFGDIGHTIMNLLVDLRNYQYTLHTIDNLFVHVEMGRSCIKIPLRKHSEVMKVISSSNEHVISIGASFNTEADSHLVCVQSKQGLYHTQAISATGQPRKVTGASFVVFNGALKTSSGFLAKSSIVEDGLMVQITRETMEGLRQALRDKEDFRITCGKVDAGDVKEYVDICWVENEEKTNKGILSPVDGKSMEGTRSEKAPQYRDLEREGKVMKCTEVYHFVKDRELSSAVPHQFAKEIAIACSTALCPHLKTLKSNGMNKIGLRVSIDSDMVEYLAGSGGHLLPQSYLNDLDDALIPVIHGGMSDPAALPLKMELVFFIIERLS
ncbi:zinc finger FYVE domain-containing protein 16 isoform X2 [Motacilla alba alba]|uniref:zinc finger FYVE domain-containing protein 16 isoform X2 n=1 Tax=Motacilla alba alba TaxID=1094192 RepID=UPI0018D54CDA|nr:zinc finger FYVE domain-containing protein 16 isoform X2 [Motacilla alba alba]